MRTAGIRRQKLGRLAQLLRERKNDVLFASDDLDSGLSSVDGRSGGSAASGVNGSGNGGGRISGTFKVPKRNDSKQ